MYSNTDPKDSYEFEMLFNSIFSKASKSSLGFRVNFFLDKNISLEIVYGSVPYIHIFKAIILEDQVVINQVFKPQDLFNRLSQLNLLNIFCNKVILWYLNGGSNG